MTLRGMAATAAALSVLVMAGCSGEDEPSGSSSTAPEVSAEETEAVEIYDADTATGEEKWERFVELAKDAGVGPNNYPSTFQDAGVTAQNLCERNLSKAAEYFAVERTLYPKAQHEANKTGTLLFVEAYCPKQVPTFTKAWEAPVAPRKSDFKIGIQIRQQQCFGSAGCNVVYQIDPKYTGLTDVQGTWDITYEVLGGDSGPVINTFTLQGMRASYPQEEVIGTASSSTQLTARVLRIERGF